MAVIFVLGWEQDNNSGKKVAVYLIIKDRVSSKINSNVSCG